MQMPICKMLSGEMETEFEAAMIGTFEALSSNLKKRKENATEVKKTSNPVVSELLEYCANFAKRLASIPEKESRDKSRHGVEMLLFEQK